MREMWVPHVPCAAEVSTATLLVRLHVQFVQLASIPRSHMAPQSAPIAHLRNGPQNFLVQAIVHHAGVARTALQVPWLARQVVPASARCVLLVSILTMPANLLAFRARPVASLWLV